MKTEACRTENPVVGENIDVDRPRRVAFRVFRGKGLKRAALSGRVPWQFYWIAPMTNSAEESISTGFRAYVLSAIEAAPILQDPYPHIYIDGVFPEDFYAELMDRIDERVHFEKAVYPGTSVDMGADDYKDHGLIASDVESDETVERVYTAFFAPSSSLEYC